MAALCVPGLLMSSAAMAATYGYVTDQGSAGSYGTGATINVYLKETLGLGENSVIDANGGLLGAAFRVTRNSGNIDLTLAGAPAFDPPTKDSAAGLWRLAETVSLFASSGPTTVDHLINIGQVTIAAPSGAIDSTFTISAYDGASGNIATFEPLVLLDTAALAPRHVHGGCS
jgi:hypothetical protein